MARLLPGWPISGKVNVEFNKDLGKIKAMHAVGQPPYAIDYKCFDFPL